MSVFKRRKISNTDLGCIPPFEGALPLSYQHVITTFSGLPGMGRISVPSVLLVLDHVFGREATEKMMCGNAPAVILNAAPLIEDHMSPMSVPNKDLQTNLMINILKECAHVEGLPNDPVCRLAYAKQSLDRFALDPEFSRHVYSILATRNQIMVPWVLVEQYPL